MHCVGSAGPLHTKKIYIYKPTSFVNNVKVVIPKTYETYALSMSKNKLMNEGRLYLLQLHKQAHDNSYLKQPQER